MDPQPSTQSDVCVCWAVKADCKAIAKTHMTEKSWLGSLRVSQLLLLFCIYFVSMTRRNGRFGLSKLGKLKHCPPRGKSPPKGSEVMIYPHGLWTWEAGGFSMLQMDQMEAKQSQAPSEKVTNGWPSHHELCWVLQC